MLHLTIAHQVQSEGTPQRGGEVAAFWYSQPISTGNRRSRSLPSVYKGNARGECGLQRYDVLLQSGLWCANGRDPLTFRGGMSMPDSDVRL